MGIAFLLREELLDGGEDHAPGVNRQLVPQVGAALCLDWRLAQEFLATGEGAEELVVQVVAVREDHDGRVLHRWLADDGPGIEGHGQALTGPLGVPDHPDAPVAKLSAGFAARLVSSSLLGDSDFGALQLRRPQGLIHRNLDGVELVIPGHFLDQSAAAVVVKDDEVADHGEEAARLKDALQHHL